MGPLPQYWSFKWVVVKICSKWIWQIIGIESSKETFQQSRSRIRNKMAQDVPQVAEKSSQRQYTCPQDFHLYILTQGSWTGQGVSKSPVLVQMKITWKSFRHFFIKRQFQVTCTIVNLCIDIDIDIVLFFCFLFVADFGCYKPQRGLMHRKQKQIRHYERVYFIQLFMKQALRTRSCVLRIFSYS